MSIILLINLPGLGAGTIAWKYRPIVQVLKSLALQDHGLAVHLYLFQHRIASERYDAQRRHVSQNLNITFARTFDGLKKHLG